MKYNAVIFDLDGTILNTLPDLTESVNYALRSYNYPERTMDEVRTFIGNGVGLLIKRSLPNGTDDETVNNALSLFKGYYTEHYADKTVPYDKIYEVLVKLKQNGLKLGVVSNKFDSAVKSLCDKFFNGIFDCVIGEMDGIPRKPAPDLLFNAIIDLEVTQKKVLYIGDSDIDIKTADNAGVDYVSVTWGFKDKEFLIKNNSKTIIGKPEEILKLI